MRARDIKPGFFKNEYLAELPPMARLLFAGLWCMADRDGRLEDRPKRIKAELFPYDDCDVDELLDGLESKRFVERYTVDEHRYIAVLKFSKHQSPHINEKASTIPAPEKHGACTVQEPEEHSSNPASSLTPSSLTTPLSDAEPSDGSNGSGIRLVREVFDYWREAMEHPDAKLKAESKRARVVRARLRDGYTVEQLKQAIDGCRASPHHRGQNATGTVYDDLELICRDDVHVEQFIAKANGKRLSALDAIDDQWGDA